MKAAGHNRNGTRDMRQETRDSFRKNIFTLQGKFVKSYKLATTRKNNGEIFLKFHELGVSGLQSLVSSLERSPFIATQFKLRKFAQPLKLLVQLRNGLCLRRYKKLRTHLFQERLELLHERRTFYIHKRRMIGDHFLKIRLALRERLTDFS